MIKRLLWIGSVVVCALVFWGCSAKAPEPETPTEIQEDLDAQLDIPGPDAP